MTTLITTALLRRHHACDYEPGERYSDEALHGAGLDEGVSLLDVLRRDDVPAADKIWLFTRPGVVELTVIYAWLALVVERALARIPQPDPRSMAVVPLLRRLAAGDTVDLEELRRIRGDADVAADAAAYDADAAYTASAAYAAAYASAAYAAYDAADAAADAAAAAYTASAAYAAADAAAADAAASAAYAAAAADDADDAAIVERVRQVDDMIHLLARMSG